MDQIYHSYVSWRASPISAGVPQDNDEFCKKYKITKKDLASFITRESYQDDLLLASLNWAKSKTPELLHIVYNEVKLNKSVADLERFIQLAHEIKRKDKESKTNNNYFFFNNLKDDQYRDIATREARLLSNSSPEAVS